MNNIRSYKLFCPGPVNIASPVKNAVSSHEIGHREAEFSQLYVSIKKKLFSIFEITDTKHYSAIVITGSGTAANEAVLSSVVGEKNILTLSNGEFGERLYDISKIHNENTFQLDFGWANRFDLKKIERFIKRNKIQVLAMVHHETSTGMLNPVASIGKICKKYNVTFVVDTVSSAACERIKIEDWNISFLTTSAGKAICSMPGLGIVVGKKSEFEKLKDNKPRTAYLDLYKFYHYSKYFTQTPNTPAVNLMFALNAALEEIVQEGIRQRVDKLNKLAKTARVHMKKLGLKFLIEERYMSNMLTTVLSPFDVNILQAKLKERGYIIYKGKGPLEKKVFQISNIGQITVSEMFAFLEELRNVLDELTGVSEVNLNTHSIAEPHAHLQEQEPKRFVWRRLFKN